MFAQVLCNIINPITILCMLGGVAMGIVFGAMPGLTAAMGIALLLPVTFAMDPARGLLTLMGIFCGGMYGGSITAILINTPGTSAAAATTLDGFPLTKKGQAARALGVSTVSSFIGGIISATVLCLIAPQLARFALKISAPETFALALFGISIIASVSGDSLLKGLAAGVLGLIISTIGIDNVTAYSRFTYGSTYLMGGISYIPALVGLFAISQCLITMEEIFEPQKKIEKIKNARSAFPNKEDCKSFIPTAITGGLIGTFIGAIPGTGGDIACFVSYDTAKRTSKHPENFGSGEIKGIAASESANNGVSGGALIPLLTLGIPGDPCTAIMLGALMVHNLTPGPLLFSTKAEIVYTLFGGIFVVNIFMLILGLSGQRIFTKIVQVPKTILTPIIMILCCVGAFAINNSYLDIIVMLVFGVIGYFLNKGKYPISPVLLAMILGPMMESNFRRSLIMSQGSYAIFFTRPISLAFLTVAVLAMFLPIIKKSLAKRINLKTRSSEIE